MIHVYADMVADLFHYGHVAFLKAARAMGDYLIVGVMSDDEAADGKRPPILTVEERVAVVAACCYVDEAIPNAPWRIDADWIVKHSIDLIVHGDDFSEQELNYFYSVPIAMGIFRTVSYTPGISTTDIILRCKAAHMGSKRSPSSARQVLQQRQAQETEAENSSSGNIRLTKDR